MKKIVKGNDFTMRIPVMKLVDGEKQAFPLPGCTDIVVRACSAYRRYELTYTVDAKEDNVILARVEGDQIPLGTYALEVRGKIFGNDWRSNEYEQFAIVDKNADADTEFGETDEGDNSVEMDTAIVFLPPDRELSALVKEAQGLVTKTDAAVSKAESAVDNAEKAVKEAENIDIDLTGGDLQITRKSGEKKGFNLMQLKGDKGDAFTYADFTAEEIAALKKPATDAASELGKYLDMVKLPVVGVAASGETVAMDANKVYAITVGQELTLNLNEPADKTVTNEWQGFFDTGATAPTVTWPEGVTWAFPPSIEMKKHYEFSIRYAGGKYYGIVYDWDV